MFKSNFIIENKKYFFWPFLSSLFFFSFAYYIILFGHLHEDVYIILNYVKNFISGNGITYYQDGPRTEGTTDALWFYLISLLSFFGIKIGVSIAILNSLGAFIISFLCLKISSEYLSQKKIYIIGIGSLLIIISSPLSAVSIGGFSTLLYSSLITIMFYIQWKGSYKNFLFIPWLGLIITIFRPDGIFIGITSTFFTLIYIYSNNEIKNYLIRNYFKQCSITFILGILYFIYRFSYFDNLFPLPFYVKTGTNLLFPGLNDTLKWFILIIPFLPLLLFIPIINKDRNRFLLSILSPISIIIAFVFILPLQNYGYRFQNSTFGIIIILYFYFFSYLIGFCINNNIKKNLIIFFSFIIFFISSFHIARWTLEWELKFLTKNEIINYFPFYLRNYTNENTTIALTEAGKMAYWTNGKKLDLVGLNNSLIAKKGLNYSSIENFDPQIFFLHTINTTHTDSCIEKDFIKISKKELIESRKNSSINWREESLPVMRAPGAAIEYIIQKRNYEIYLFCFLGSFSHLFAFNEKSNLSNELISNILKDIRKRNNNLSYLSMANLID